VKRMRAPRFLRAHARWREQLDGYADDELEASDSAALERHLESCSACRLRLEQTRSLKVALAALPQVATPRSFRLTPGMVAVPVHLATRPAQGAFRVAQFATGLALAALA